MLVAFRVLEFSLVDLFGNFYSLVFSRCLRHSFDRPTEATLFPAVGLPFCPTFKPFSTALWFPFPFVFLVRFIRDDLLLPHFIVCCFILFFIFPPFSTAHRGGVGLLSSPVRTTSRLSAGFWCGCSYLWFLRVTCLLPVGNRTSG